MMCLNACLNVDCWFDWIRIKVNNVYVEFKEHVEHEMMNFGFNLC